MSKKDRRIVLIAQCLVNPYCRVHILGQNFPLSKELTNYLMEKHVGIIQYLCPETSAMGLMRNPQGRQQYDNVFFRITARSLSRHQFSWSRNLLRTSIALSALLA